MMLDCPTRILLLDEPRSDETPRVLTKRLLVALEFSENIFKYDPRSARDEHENFNPSVIRHPFEMSFKLPRTFYFFYGHTHILSHTWVYEYVWRVENDHVSLLYALPISPFLVHPHKKFLRPLRFVHNLEHSAFHAHCLRALDENDISLLQDSLEFFTCAR